MIGQGGRGDASGSRGMIPTGWMIGWTRPNAEFDVAAELRKIGFEAVVPTIRKSRLVRGHSTRNCGPRNRGFGKMPVMEIVLAPAFPRYLMFAGDVWQRANRVDGMTLVVRRPGDRDAPGVLPEPVAKRLMGWEGDGVIDDLTKTIEAIQRFAKGANIQITEGPFANLPGVVIGHDGRNVRVLLSVLGGQRETAIAPESIRAA